VAVWANIHGSFVLGPILGGVFLLGGCLEKWSRREPPIDRAVLVLGGITALSGLAMLLTPYGVTSLLYVFRLSSNPIIRDFVTEWEPTTVNSWYGVLCLGSFLLVFALAYATRAYRRLAPTEALLLLAFGYLGAASVRGIIWWGLAMAPILALQLAAVPSLQALDAASARRRVPRGAGPLNAVAITVAGLAMVGSLPWLKPANPLLPPDKRSLVSQETPVAMAAFLARLPEGARIFNYQGWGGYFDWALWPRQRAFVDGRIEVHPRDVWMDYLYVSFGHANWERTLEQYGSTHLALSRLHQPDLIALVRQSPGWALLYEDQLGAVFTRRQA
jgi:hypothetical protein